MLQLQGWERRSRFGLRAAILLTILASAAVSAGGAADAVTPQETAAAAVAPRGSDVVGALRCAALRKRLAVAKRLAVSKRLTAAKRRGQRARIRVLTRSLRRCLLEPQPQPPAAPQPLPPPPPPPPAGNCHASYPTVCIPPAPPDLDCGQIAHRGFTVRHDVPDADPHGFDGDKDGVGCET
jgi:hypothetical protein